MRTVCSVRDPQYAALTATHPSGRCAVSQGHLGLVSYHPPPALEKELHTSQQRSEPSLLPPAGQLLDPTDSTGSPSERPQPGMPWLWSVDHTLAFVNEPPPGRSTNVEVGRGNSKLDLPFIATRVSSGCG